MSLQDGNRLSCSASIAHRRFTSKKLARKISEIKIALVQLTAGEDRDTNIKIAVQNIKTAKQKEAKVQIIFLPDHFNAPFDAENCLQHAEKIPSGATSQALLEEASCKFVYVVGGAIQERRGSSKKLFNTTTVWSVTGKLIHKYRKEIERHVSEQNWLSVEDDLTTFYCNDVKMGLGIGCHLNLAKKFHADARECTLLIYTGTFNSSDPEDWIRRACALAKQFKVWVALVKPAQGHSLVVNPLGEVTERLSEKQEILIANIDVDLMREVREKMVQEQTAG